MWLSQPERHSETILYPALPIKPASANTFASESLLRLHHSIHPTGQKPACCATIATALLLYGFAPPASLRLPSTLLSTLDSNEI